MTIINLVHALTRIASEYGWERQVRVVDAEGEWPFSLHVEELAAAEGTRLLVCIDTTCPEDGSVLEPTPLAPRVTDQPPSPSPD